MRTNTKAVVTGDRLVVHWGTGALWELAVIIYICTALTDLLQIRGYSREKAGFSSPYKVYGAESAFLILISDLFEPVGPPLTIVRFAPMLTLALYPVSLFGEPGTSRLRMCENFTENCILSINSNFQMHATSHKMM